MARSPLTAQPSERSVFLDVPFDARYEPLFVDLVAAVTALGRIPRCVLEIQPSKDRLKRILSLMSTCRVSIHDLSRVQRSRPGLLPRFNMPFELGLAVAFSHLDLKHEFFIFEEKRFRLLTTLSDLSGYDAEIHGGTAEGILGAVMNCLGRRGRPLPADALLRHAKDVARAARKLERSHLAHTLFARETFLALATASAENAKQAGLIE
jgi:hypothetical protein